MKSYYSSSDNSIVKFDGTTGKLIQNTGVTIDDSNNITTSGNIIAGNVMSSGTFIDGFTGSGTKLDLVNNSLTLDSLTVRGTMNIYELVVNKIRATNGSLWVSDSVKVDSVNSNIPTQTVYVNTDTLVPFTVNDVVKAQNFDGNNVRSATGIVTAISGTAISIWLYNINNTFWEGANIVRIGNTTDSNRQGALYLTSSDSGSPYMDILDNVSDSSISGKIKIRLGKLSGISGQSGYGFWGSINGADTAFSISSSGYANIAGWNFDNNYIWSGTKQLNDDFTSSGITLGNGAIRAMNFKINTDGTAYFRGNITATSGEIGNWNINTDGLYRDNSTNSAGLAPSDYPFYAGNTYSNRALAPFRVATDGEVNITSKCSIQNTTTGCEVLMGGTTFPFGYGSGALYVKGTTNNSGYDTNAIHAQANGGNHNYAIKAEATGTGYNTALFASSYGGTTNTAAKFEGEVKISYGGIDLLGGAVNGSSLNGGGLTLSLTTVTSTSTTLNSAYRIHILNPTTANGNYILPDLNNFKIGEYIVVIHYDTKDSYIKPYTGQTIHGYNDTSGVYITLASRGEGCYFIKRTTTDWVCLGKGINGF